MQARPGRTRAFCSWTRLLLALCVAGVGLALVGPGGRVPPAGAAGNADAAHACQQGGYASLYGVNSSAQTITFKNEGDCVGYAAHGGQFTTPLPTCTITATTGCLTFIGITLSSILGTGNNITLTGATTFDDTCLDCFPMATPNALATGGGDYVETNSSGSVISEGIYRIADTAGSLEGLGGTDFVDSAGNTAACSPAYARVVAVVATLIDKNTGATQFVEVAVFTNPTLNAAVAQTVSDLFRGPVPSTAITC
jgi:hypothetical protein